MLMSRFLRLVLLADAITTAGSGLLFITVGDALEPWLNIPAPLMRYAGIALLPYAAFVGYLAAQTHVTRSAVWTVIGCNALWAIDSVVLLLTGWVSPTALGYAVVVLQAGVVAAFAELQFTGLKNLAVQVRHG